MVQIIETDGFPVRVRLSQLNDHRGYDFNQIANVVEQQEGDF
jgi:hypothetical protein